MSATSQSIELKLKINGQALNARVHPMARLLDVIREEFRLTGTKEGCGEGECGACSVMIGDTLVNSCLIPAIQAQGAEIRTIEGVATEAPGTEAPVLHAVQRAFLEKGGAQCGICTPGMVLAAIALLDRRVKLGLDTYEIEDGEIREGLAGNLCRCTGYTKIFESVKRAGELLAVPESEGP